MNTYKCTTERYVFSVISTRRSDNFFFLSNANDVSQHLRGTLPAFYSRSFNKSEIIFWRRAKLERRIEEKLGNLSRNNYLFAISSNLSFLEWTVFRCSFLWRCKFQRVKPREKRERKKRKKSSNRPKKHWRTTVTEVRTCFIFVLSLFVLKKDNKRRWFLPRLTVVSNTFFSVKILFLFTRFERRCQLKGRHLLPVRIS